MNSSHDPANPQPQACRPYLPDPAYGIPTSRKGLLPWSHATQRMADARVYWIGTVSPDGRPHATPVDGVWLDDRLYFGGSPQARRSRNLAINPAACVHLESGSDVVILHGEARLLRPAPRPLSVRLAEASTAKYGYPAQPEDYEARGVFEFRPQKAFAWAQFPKDATRWRIR